jgi:phospholipase/carboxylesterase
MLLVAAMGCRNDAAGPPAQPEKSTPRGPVIPEQSEVPHVALSPIPVAPALKGLPEEHGLEYEELVTGTAGETESLPIVIAVHGLGDRPDRFMKLFHAFDKPARFIAPQGLDKSGSGYSWFDTRIRNGVVERLAGDEIMTSAGRLARLALDLAKRYPKAGQPVITGFSQGGVLSFAVAVYFPETISASYPLSGVLPTTIMPDDGPGTRVTVPIRAAHGHDDVLVPYALTVETVDLLKKLDFDAELTTYQFTAHRVSHEMRADLFDRLNISLGNPNN